MSKQKKGYFVHQSPPRTKPGREKVTIPNTLKSELKKIFNKPDKRLRFAHFIIWAYIFCRLLLTDYDLLFFTHHFPITSSSYILYRNTFICALVLFAWFIFGNKRFFRGVALFFLFPFYPVAINAVRFIIWTLPKILINRKCDFLLFTYIDKSISLIVNLRFTLLKAMLYLLGFIILFGFDGSILWLSLPIFGILQLMHLYKRYEETYAPIKIFQIKIKSINKNLFDKSSFNTQVENFTKNQSSTVEIAQMEYILLVSEVANLFNTKINEVLSRRSYYQSTFFKFLYSISLSVLIFTSISYAIYKLDPSNYIFKGTPDYFDFFYYSFFNLFPEGVDLEPNTWLAKIIRISAVTVGILINLIILGIYIVVRTDRYKENLQELSLWTDNYSTHISAYFLEKYGKHPIEGLEKLKEAGSQIGEAIEYLKKLLKEK